MSKRVIRACAFCTTLFSLKPCENRSWTRQCCSEDCLVSYKRTDEFRFWRRVDTSGPVPAHRPELGPCWIWTGKRRTAAGFGYGVMAKLDGTHGEHRAHRYSWEMANGPVPAGRFVLHACDVPECVNPAHLFVGTQLDNMRDMDAKNRRVNPSPRLGEANNRARLTADKVVEIREAFAAGQTQEEIGKRYGFKQSHISNVVLGQVWKHVGGPIGSRLPNKTRLKGANNHNSKLTDADVREIRRLRAAGARRVDLVRRFGIGYSPLKRILDGTAWKHVKDDQPEAS